jgi:acetyl esterase/lipase
MVSPESRAYFRRLHESPAFGASGFDLDALRQCMATRREPTIAARCIRSEIGGIPCEWVIAEGSDPDLRLLYLHGGGYVSGSGAFYLARAAHLSGTRPSG